VIYGRTGDDQMVGGDFSGDPGDPSSKNPDGNDTIDGGNGNDFAAGMQGNDTITGGNGNDELFGGPGNDTVSGDNGNDIVVGNFGSDTLSGGNGDDILDGDNVDENNNPWPIGSRTQTVATAGTARTSSSSVIHSAARLEGCRRGIPPAHGADPSGLPWTAWTPV
jgi:Ca2+-binding RTX toxin-like protein